jgi:hypothetical protein
VLWFQRRSVQIDRKPRAFERQQKLMKLIPDAALGRSMCQFCNGGLEARDSPADRHSRMLRHRPLYRPCRGMLKERCRAVHAGARIFSRAAERVRDALAEGLPQFVEHGSERKRLRENGCGPDRSGFVVSRQHDDQDSRRVYRVGQYLEQS